MFLRKQDNYFSILHPPSPAIPNNPSNPLNMVRTIPQRRISAGAIENSIQILPQDDRKKQPVWVFILILICMIAITIWNSFTLLDLADRKTNQRNLLVMCGIVTFTALVNLISDLYLAGWKKVLGLYFYLDTLVPMQVAFQITFYYLMKFFQPWNIAHISAVAFFPIFLITLPGNLRVNVRYAKWHRWQVLAYKIACGLTGLCSFYVGFVYLRGGYKISKGYLPQLESKVKNLLLLYVFGMAQFSFQLYKRISDFDQTNQIKSIYELRTIEEMEQQLAVRLGQQAKLLIDR